MLTTYCGHSMYCLTILYVYAPRFCGQREGHVEIMENMDSQLDSDLWKSQRDLTPYASLTPFGLVSLKMAVTAYSFTKPC